MRRAPAISTVCTASRVDPTTRRVFVNDRTNGRVQVFDENGKYLDEWNFGPRPPMDIHSFIVTSDHNCGRLIRALTRSSATT